MDVISKLNKSINMLDLLNHYGFKRMKQQGNIVRSCCEIHGGDNPTSFVFDTETGLWFCHTGCGGGDVYTLVEKMEGIGFTEAVRFIAKFFDVDIGDLNISERKDKQRKELEAWIALISSKRVSQISAEEYKLNCDIRQVISVRDFKQSTLEHFNVGYTDSVNLLSKSNEEYTLSTRLVFPVYQNNILIGANFRKIKSKDFPKWSLQPIDLKYGSVLYNYDNAKKSESIVIVEGIYDVFAYHELNIQAVATFGSSISKGQYELLIRTGADLILSFDGDNAGRKGTEKAIKMFKNKSRISVVDLPDGEDASSITREQLLNLYNLRRKV